MELCDASLVSWIGWQYKEFIHITVSRCVVDLPASHC